MEGLSRELTVDCTGGQVHSGQYGWAGVQVVDCTGWAGAHWTVRVGGCTSGLYRWVDLPKQVMPM